MGWDGGVDTQELPSFFYCMILEGAKPWRLAVIFLSRTRTLLRPLLLCVIFLTVSSAEDWYSIYVLAYSCMHADGALLQNGLPHAPFELIKAQHDVLGCLSNTVRL